MLSRGGPSDERAVLLRHRVDQLLECLEVLRLFAVALSRYNSSARWRIASRSTSAKPMGAVVQAVQATAQATFWFRLDPQKRQGDDSYAVGAAVRLGTGGEDDEVGDVATHLLLEPVEVTDVPVIDSRC